MKKQLICFVVSLVFLSVSFIGVAHAKFTCEVEEIDGTRLVLKNCQVKGLKRLKTGDTVAITKKRNSKEKE